MTDKKILFLSDDNFESPVPRVMIDPWNGSSWKIIQKKVHTMRQLRSVNVKELEVVGCIVTFLTALCGDVDRSDRDVNDESEATIGVFEDVKEVLLTMLMEDEELEIVLFHPVLSEESSRRVMSQREIEFLESMDTFVKSQARIVSINYGFLGTDSFEHSGPRKEILESMFMLVAFHLNSYFANLDPEAVEQMKTSEAIFQSATTSSTLACNFSIVRAFTSTHSSNDTPLDLSSVRTSTSTPISTSTPTLESDFPLDLSPIRAPTPVSTSTYAHDLPLDLSSVRASASTHRIQPTHFEIWQTRFIDDKVKYNHLIIPIKEDSSSQMITNQVQARIEQVQKFKEHPNSEVEYCHFAWMYIGFDRDKFYFISCNPVEMKLIEIVWLDTAYANPSVVLQTIMNEEEKSRQNKNRMIFHDQIPTVDVGPHFMSNESGQFNELNAHYQPGASLPTSVTQQIQTLELSNNPNVGSGRKNQPTAYNQPGPSRPIDDREEKKIFQPWMNLNADGSGHMNQPVAQNQPEHSLSIEIIDDD